jgi:hypothetical protein
MIKSIFFCILFAFVVLANKNENILSDVYSSSNKLITEMLLLPNELLHR